MVDRISQLERQFELKFQALNWETCEEDQAILGGLEGVASLIQDGIKRNKVRQLAAITCTIKLPSKMTKQRYSLAVHAALTYNKRCPKLVPAAALSRFYQSFFDSKVTTTSLNSFIHDNISLIITRHVYSSAKKYSFQ